MKKIRNTRTAFRMRVKSSVFFPESKIEEEADGLNHSLLFSLRF